MSLRVSHRMIGQPMNTGSQQVRIRYSSTDGTAIAVTDEQILEETRALAAAEGTWTCPEGAACVVAARELRESGWIAEHERVVVLNTGSGLIYPETVPDGVVAQVPVLARDGVVPG